MNQSIDGDQVPCEFKNLHINANAARIIYRNIINKLALQRGSIKNSIEQSDVEKISSYERKLAYLIRLHLKDILTSDHRHVWFHIQTKSIDDIEDRTQIFKKIPEDFQVVYSFGSMLSYDTFIGHTETRSLARINLLRRGKAIQLETSTHYFVILYKNIDSQILINHSTKDNSIQVILMLKALPIIEQKAQRLTRENERFIKELSLCSDLLIRFYPASQAWAFLRELPIAGYSRQGSSDKFHINFAMFSWQKANPIMGMPSYLSFHDSYGIEMLWSLGYLFRDKYNADFQFMLNNKTNFYHLCCTIWRNLKSNHCYQLRDALKNQTSKQNQQNSNSSSELKEVAFAILTPNRIEYQPMQTTISHRGFSLYPPKDWLLVHMRDDNGIDKIMNLDLPTRIQFRNYMLKGIPCGNRLFQYFGSSGSQMNNQAGWFLALPPGKTMDSARQQIGDLSKILNVSTYISRVGLYLTTTKTADIELKFSDKLKETDLTPEKSLFSSFKRLIFKTKTETISYVAIIIDDIKRNGFCFTDGCGKISYGLAKKVAQNIGIHVIEKSDVPSAFQVRIAGCKGMLAIDPKSKANQYYIQVRKSMVKFESDDWTLHIVDHSRPMPLSLNNQVIRLLYDLGNSYDVFESIQTRCIDRKEFWHPPAKSYLNAMDSLDQTVINEKRQKYKNAKHFLQRNKIPLPVNEARCLFGIADETGTLKAGECFIQYRVLQESPGSKTYRCYEGSVIVTKNPCLHPGDVRKLKAVYSEKLEPYIRDCIVFSVHGERPNCNEMAGSDLDGDQYWVYWGDEFQIREVALPLVYPSANKSTVNHITNEMIVDHILDTFTNKAPGIIANTHKVIADQHLRGTFSKECEQCALLFARAIDARKTGEDINLSDINRLKNIYCQTYPEWMMKFDKPPMDPPSKSINEILYRKAIDAWIHSDNYEDVVRPFLNAEHPSDAVIIDINDTDLVLEEDENENRFGCCRNLVCLVFVILLLIGWVYGMIFLFNWIKHWIKP